MLYKEEQLLMINHICNTHVINEEQIVEIADKIAPIVDSLGGTEWILRLLDSLNDMSNFQIVSLIRFITDYTMIKE